MIEFLIIASLATLLAVWLLFMPLQQADIAKRDKQKTLFALTLFVVVFPLLFYLFMSH